MLTQITAKEVLAGGKGVLPTTHDKAKQAYYGMALHVNGVLPRLPYNSNGLSLEKDSDYTEYRKLFDTYLFAKHPREKEEQRYWRYAQYKPFQRAPFVNIIQQITSAIFQGSGYSIDIDNTEDSDYFWDTDIDGTPNFISQFISKTTSIMLDGEGYLIPIPNKAFNELAKGEKVKPRLHFIHTKNIKYLTDDEILWVNDDETEGWLVNKLVYWKFVKDEKGSWIDARAEGYWAHLLGFLPIVKAGGISNGCMYDSWLVSGRAFADEFVSAKSAEQLVNKEAAHPYIIATAEDCTECQGTGTHSCCSKCNKYSSECGCEHAVGEFVRPYLSECTSCGGSGRQSRNPGDWMIVPKEDMDGGDLIKIITPDVSVNAHLKKTSDDIYRELERALYIRTSDTNEGESGISKTKTLESRYQFFMAISNDFFDRLLPQLILISLMLRNAKNVNGVLKPYSPKFTIIKPTQLSIKTSADLLVEYQISAQAKMPKYVRDKQIGDYLDKHFGGDNVLLKKHKIILEMDMLATDTESEILQAVQANVVSIEDWQLHKQLPNALDLLIEEVSPNRFLSMDNSEIREKVIKFVKIKNIDNGEVNKTEGGGQRTDNGGGSSSYYGGGNSATKTGNSPTGTGSYNQRAYENRERNNQG